jgi:hypothetical protein
MVESLLTREGERVDLARGDGYHLGRHLRATAGVGRGVDGAVDEEEAEGEAGITTGGIITASTGWEAVSFKRLRRAVEAEGRGEDDLGWTARQRQLGRRRKTRSLHQLERMHGFFADVVLFSPFPP